MLAFAVLLISTATVHSARQQSQITREEHQLEAKSIVQRGVRRAVTLSGLNNSELNTQFEETFDREFKIQRRPTFWSFRGTHFLFYCEADTSWHVARASRFKAMQKAAKRQHKTKHCQKTHVKFKRQGVQRGYVGYERSRASDGWKLNPDLHVLFTETCGSQKDQEACHEKACRWDAGRCGEDWSILGRDGPKVSHIFQGDLGNCYFLAAIAAIASSHPEVIEDTFFDIQLWQAEPPVYSTRWLLDGKVTKVTVDDWLPVHAAVPRPSLISYSPHANHRHLWPVILQKSWAKIFGSFQATEHGNGPEAFKAITQAPIDIYVHSKEEISMNLLWKALKKAVNSSFPIYASSRADAKHGLARNHAFAVLGVHKDRVSMKTDTLSDERHYFQKIMKAGQASRRYVRLYNPWSFTRYEKAMQDDDGSRSFSVKLEHFFKNFKHTAVARVQKGYQLSSQVLLGNWSAGRGCKAEVELRIVTDKPFYVQLEWPNYRLVKEAGCAPLKTPEVSMTVCKKGGWACIWSTPRTLSQDQIYMDMSNLRADLEEGGTYTVKVKASLKDHPWIKELVLNTYASAKAEFQILSAPAEPSGTSESHHCARLVERLMNLDNATANGDASFPPARQSIGEKHCGDAAQGIMEDCHRYDHWLRIPDIMAL
mmetsp:Transcript_10854/g.19314  ORF Transcript_10854/g.19314 Transcript_10854/m.19314 type:complete len:653 (+) Transcript_10854:101-2059(+)|eukprot:CAMPEP_0197660416 /NCGR_PEP_ID=MMETSP1338-20131121/50831_1 /TAXON_ID=43686 ORGANISM="Pelagodinium beii, Strain RCC1491" /NCGR_SAMPLE_ID=MMETSP1338 /ASSEMBLY_ACC=CAM_ASM_000754 /LENGTH=652 /DNA_ID=CAMNT_0043237761 /DNA_START=101 /DNA_END=2059 /DNA_ORIENTATION=+